MTLFSRAGLCILSGALCLSPVVVAQDSNPKSAKKPASHLLFTKDDKYGDEEFFGVHSYDLGKKTISSVLAKSGENYHLKRISPMQKTMVLLQRDEDSFKTVFADLKSGKLYETQPFKSNVSVAFKSERRVYVIQKVKEDQNGIKTRLFEIDIDGKNRNLIWETKDGYWNDVPLTISPNRKYLIYFMRGETRRGLMLFNIATGKESKILEGSTIAFWSPDSKRLGVFNKNTRSAVVCSLNEKDDTIKEDKKLEKGTIITGWLNNKAFVVMSFNRDGASSKIYGLSKEPLVLAKAAPANSSAIRRYFDYDKASHSIVYLAKGESGPTLMRALIKDGKVTGRTVVANGGRLSQPYFIHN
ncbi:MAG: hypothetical protein P1V97_35855 [Planctomycetota bacterium]|nr:hypothetical protein [Planctomycetota bacterium]